MFAIVKHLQAVIVVTPCMSDWCVTVYWFACVCVRGHKSELFEQTKETLSWTALTASETVVAWIIIG